MLDEQILQGLMSLDASGHFLEQTVLRYEQRLLNGRMELENALTQRDDARCRLVLHSIEGCSRMIGACDFANTCRILRSLIVVEAAGHEAICNLLDQYDDAARINIDGIRRFVRSQRTSLVPIYS